MRGLPGHDAFHQPGAWICGYVEGLRQHRGCQPAPLINGERGGLLGQARGGRVGQPDQRPGPHDVLITGLADGVQDGQRPVSLPDAKDAVGPRQRRRLARGRRPLQAGVDHRIHRSQCRGPLNARAKLGQPASRGDREHVLEGPRPAGDPLDPSRSRSRSSAAPCVGALPSRYVRDA